ncbi:iron-containing redox enzyme family protein [Naasia lichenicola]|uniref:Iron-containing redox enzyme family protein n=1 Tax=Naasia lichenicola TaxID=2565933 RepID=A0A4S4FR80_9MICO|nr:iron-containing redox enzyme family protein [Naasia lichenicola]THG32821.1 iron-containing redox enzyme family protein [Naasia lichenicola]
MRIPESRGPASAVLLDILATGGGSAPERDSLRGSVDDALAATEDIFRDDDLQLTLFLLYQLGYGGVDGSDELEWDLTLLGARAALEAALETALRDRVPVPKRPEPNAESVATALFSLTGQDSGPSLSRFVAKKATDGQLRELVVLKSVYALKEADPQSWAIPRLQGRAKAALVEILADEYGGGRAKRMHSTIFAGAMTGLGLDSTDGAYLDSVPALALASVNVMSLFGLHRRLRGASVGLFAAYEMTSSLPNRQYGNGVRRLGYGDDVAWYFDEHVEADAVHEQIAARDMAGGLVEAEPHLLDDVLFGAAAGMTVDGWLGEDVFRAWSEGTSALRRPLPVAAPAQAGQTSTPATGSA